MAAPPGPPIQYPKENEGPALFGGTVTITSLALLTMIARLYVRLQIIRDVGWDDYTMGLSMILCIVGQGIIIPEIYYGAGRHVDQITPEDFQMGFKLNFITQPFYLWGICFVKLSVGFFLLRIANTAFYRRTIISIMIFMIVYTFGSFMSIMLQCTNLAVQWDRTAKGTCWTPYTLKALGYTNVGLNISTDLLFSVIIPIPMLWHVQMNRRQKISVVGVLTLGVFATGAAATRLGYLPKYGMTGDWLWDSKDITLWVVMECNVGIIAGNLPSLKPLFRSVLGSTYGYGSRGRSNSKPLSRPYGNDAHPRSTGKDAYNSLGSRSGRENERPLSPYAAYEAHVMTTIGANKSGSDKSPTNSINTTAHDGASAGHASAESIELLDEQQQPKSWGKLGGILKTTQVSQERDEESLRPQRETKDIV